MNLEFAHLRENIEACEAMTAASKAWTAILGDLVKLPIREMTVTSIATQSRTPRAGPLRIATDGERNGRLAWVPGARP